MRYRSYTAGPDDDGKRLDRIVRTMFPEVPLSAVARLIRTGEVRINGDPAKNNSRVSASDKIEAPERFGTPRNERSDDARRVDGKHSRDGDRRGGRRPGGNDPGSGAKRGNRGPRRNDGDRGVRGSHSDPFPPVIHRSGELLVLNKPAGMAVHGPRSLTTLVVRRAEEKEWTRPSLSFRPGPVHRLDKETSGVQLFALSIDGARRTAETFASRETRKFYVAIVGGRMERSIECDESIHYDRNRRNAVVGEGKSARTLLVPIAYRPESGYSLIVAVPRTGRTHQIRAHAAHAGHPLVDDFRYGGPRWSTPGAPQFHLLHHLALALPQPGGSPLFYQAPLAPGTFGFVQSLFGDSAPIEKRIDATIADLCTDLATGTTISL